jgi:iron complex transport system ATP-binding protein
MLGRTPFHGLFDNENENDRRAVAAAIKLVGIVTMAEKHWNEISGGERQKVVLATALAQSPRLMLLDEPTVHLDIANQVEILGLVRNLNREHNLTVIAAIHDLNMAAMYFDRLVILKAGRILADGSPHEVLTEENIFQAFAATVKVGDDQSTGAPHVYILPQL